MGKIKLYIPSLYTLTKFIAIIILLNLFYQCSESYNKKVVAYKENKITDTFKVFNIPYDMYYQNVTVVVANDFNKAHRYISDSLQIECSEDDFKAAEGITFTNMKEIHPVIWIKTVNPEVSHHELFHATQSILENAGVKLTEETGEVYAYSLSYMIKQFNHNIYGKTNKQ